jgi:hypothetical protein
VRLRIGQREEGEEEEVIFLKIKNRTKHSGVMSKRNILYKQFLSESK